MPLAEPDLGRFKFIRWLTPGQTPLALDDAGRQVVLKPLADDCLLDGKLHPSIRDRLARVRELAHPGIANLHGVERAGGGTFLVWEFIEGQNLEQHTAGLTDERRLGFVRRETTLVVQALHALGLVHGAIHARNILVDPAGRIRLTHISPLLYDDLATDIHDLQVTLGTETSAEANRSADDPDPADRPLRRKLLLTALLLLIAAAGVSMIIWLGVTAGTPRPLVPPQAPDTLTSR